MQFGVICHVFVTILHPGFPLMLLRKNRYNAVDSSKASTACSRRINIQENFSVNKLLLPFSSRILAKTRVFEVSPRPLWPLCALSRPRNAGVLHFTLILTFLDPCVTFFCALYVKFRPFKICDLDFQFHTFIC